MTAGRSDRFIKSYVCELEDPLFTSMSPETLKVYEICRRLANYKDELWWNGSQYITIPRGSLVTSVLSLSGRFKLSRQKIRSAIRTLISRKLLTNDSTNRSTNAYTILSVTNYGAYSGGAMEEQPMDQPTDQPTKKPTPNQRLTTLIEVVEVVEEEKPSSRAAAKKASGFEPVGDLIPASLLRLVNETEKANANGTNANTPVMARTKPTEDELNLACEALRRHCKEAVGTRHAKIALGLCTLDFLVGWSSRRRGNKLDHPGGVLAVLRQDLAALHEEDRRYTAEEAAAAKRWAESERKRAEYWEAQNKPQEEP